MLYQKLIDNTDKQTHLKKGNLNFNVRVAPEVFPQKVEHLRYLY